MHITNEVFKEIWLTVTKAGYALGGGLFFCPKVGLSVKKTKNNAFSIGCGYEMQQTGNSYYTQHVENSVLLSVGLTW